MYILQWNGLFSHCNLYASRHIHVYLKRTSTKWRHFITWILISIHICKKQRNIILNDREYRITRYETPLLFYLEDNIYFSLTLLTTVVQCYSYYSRVSPLLHVRSVNKSQYLKWQDLKPHAQSWMYENTVFQDKRKFKE